jgi:hypothetical protein
MSNAIVERRIQPLASITHITCFNPLILFCTMTHMLVSSTAVRTPGTKQELQGYQLPLSYTMSRRNVQVCHKNKKKKQTNQIKKLNKKNMMPVLGKR